MHDIAVRVCGDHWLNPDEVRNTLINLPITEHVVLDLGAEGPSLVALGLANMLDQICQQTGRDSQTININHWPNTAEELAYRKLHNPKLSHFFWMCERYKNQDQLVLPNSKLFGLFVGRRTVPRAVMLWQTHQHFADRTLFSLMESITPMPWEMPTQGRDLEKLTEWLTDSTEFKTWWENCPLHSLDQHKISDQYDDIHNTNRDLLQFYNQFDIEIVAETYTRGQTFFPTEKTIRPITACKPMLVHGPKYYLERLRDLGFLTWNKIWDESYDQLEGPARWQAIFDVMKDLDSRDQVVLRMECAEVTAHNQTILNELIERYRPG